MVSLTNFFLCWHISHGSQGFRRTQYTVGAAESTFRFTHNHRPGHLPFFSVIKGGYGLSFANRGKTSSAFCVTAHALCIETFRCDCIEAGLVIDANLPLSNRPVMMSISNSLIDRGGAVCAKLGHLTDDEETGNPRTGASPPGIVSGFTHSPDLF